MSVYSRFVFPWLCDLALDRPLVARWRRELLAGVTGEVLEIGVGTGLNLPHYPPRVRTIATVDPNAAMSRRLERRTAASGVKVDRRLGRGERLPFDDAAFDYVVSTFTLCSVQDVEQVVSEVRRVLKPGGQFVFLEHGLSPDEAVARRQRRWNWLQRRLADGCRLDLDVRQVLQTQPFLVSDARNFYLEKTPQTHGYLYLGAARK